MNILLIHTSMSAGGIQSVVCSLANQLSREGESVTVCSITKPKETDVFWNRLDDGVCKTSLGKQENLFSILIVFKVLKFLKCNSFDVVHIHGFFCYYFLSILCLHRRIKFIYTLHSDAYMENGRWDKRLLVVKKYCFRKGWMKPITISNASQDSFYRLYGCKSVLIYNGIPRPAINSQERSEVIKYKFTSNTRVFIHVGRIDVPKNQYVLCQVFQHLIGEGHDVVLLLAGGVTSSSIYNELKSMFSDRIVYLGVRHDVIQLMAQCEAMCLPSLWEGLPIVMLEALSVGCIPICSPVGGIVNVITNGENGILSESSQFDDFYHAVHSFLDLSKEKRIEMRHRCIESFQSYTVERMTQNYLNAYKR